MSKNRTAPTEERPEPPAEGLDARWRKKPEDWTAAERRELEQLSKLHDVEILKRAGTAGPALIGRPLAYLAAKVRITNPEGTFGPAILDPEWDAKDLAKRGLRRGEGGRIEPIDAPPAESGAGERRAHDLDGDNRVTAEELDAQGVPIDPGNLTDPRNPWTYVTLSGAKQLAMAHQVSHKPRITRAELIQQLQETKVEPPPVPAPEDLTDDNDPDDVDERRRRRLETELERSNPGATEDTR